MEVELNVEAQSCFRALADPTRREILRMLGKGERNIGAVADEFPVTRAAINKHLGILKEASLLTARREGRAQILSLNPAGMKPAKTWISEFDAFWDDKLSQLKHNIESDKND